MVHALPPCSQPATSSGAIIRPVVNVKLRLNADLRRRLLRYKERAQAARLADPSALLGVVLYLDDLASSAVRSRDAGSTRISPVVKNAELLRRLANALSTSFN